MRKSVLNDQCKAVMTHMNTFIHVWNRNAGPAG